MTETQKKLLEDLSKEIDGVSQYMLMLLGGDEANDVGDSANGTELLLNTCVDDKHTEYTPREAANMIAAYMGTNPDEILELAQALHTEE